jgi:hypothetical protein
MYDKLIEGLLEMMKRWEPLGQGVFLLLLLVLAASIVLAALRYVVVFFRGWPPAGSDEIEGAAKKKA